jgi:transposase InsO family protein
MFARFRHAESRESQVDAVAPVEEVVATTAADPSVPGNTGVRSGAADFWEEAVADEDAAREVLDDSGASAVLEFDAQVSHGHTGVSDEEMTAWPAAPEEADHEEGTCEAPRGDEVQPPEVDLSRLGLAARPRRRHHRALAQPEVSRRAPLTGAQRLLLLDTWRRSNLPAGDFAALVGISKHTLYKWNQQFAELGPAGLEDQPRRVRQGSQLPDLTQRTILMLKQSHPEWGCQRISDLLVRGPALPASASAVARVLHEAGYEGVEVPTHSHPDKVRHFERARANEMWQSDLFTFVLKRQSRRVHLVAFLDDHSRFIVSYGLHATASTALVLEALEAAIASYGPAEEILTDNGPQYVTWRGTSQFAKHLQKRGIKQLVAHPRRPQTLGKIERFWGTLWREFLEAAIFVDLTEARVRIGHFIDYYNFQRGHRGIGGLVPADRFFGAAREILQTLQQRVAANALELARHGVPRAPFYVTGQVEGRTFSVHAEGERLILRKEDEPRQEITLTGPAPARGATAPPLPTPVCPQAAPPSGAGEPADAPPPAPGTSALDGLLTRSADEPAKGGV